MGRESKTEGMARLAAMTALCAGLASCATLEFEPPPVPPLAGLARYDIERIDPLALSNEMRQFVDARLGGETSGHERAWQLTHTLLDPWLFPFEYDPRVTLTAREAFRTRRGNCLTFSNLYVAMAREAGLDAWYREVEIAPEWSSVDDTLLVSMHVNAAVRENGKMYVIDVSRREVQPGERVRTLSDEEAEAQFYNNLGVDALLASDLSLAYAYFRKAAETSARVDYVWSNLGVVLRRNGQTADALRAYETALRIDPDNTQALNNLFSIYEEDGMVEQAAALQARVERIRRRNPYYLHYLAEVAAEAGDWPTAIGYSERAIGLKNDEYRFHYTLAQMQYRADQRARAEANLAIARGLAPASVDPGALTLPGVLPRPSED
jgi:tetratricopeptide (TPR) repeat protein